MTVALNSISRATFVEAPSIGAIDMQVRTATSVPFSAYMLATGEAPSVDAIDMQVRTATSVPFTSYMLGKAERHDAPSVDAIDMQVRTATSVPFTSYMLGKTDQPDAPSVGAIDMQVRTATSVPFSAYMRGAESAGEKPSIGAIDMQVRTATSVPFSPYMLGAHAEELLKKRIMISPVLVVWQYRVANEAAFKGWLATKEILLSEGRMSADEEIKGVRYGGTYRIQKDGAAHYKTVWGYTSEASMNAMLRLCSAGNASATLVQLELIDFVKGVKGFIDAGGKSHFTEETLISAAAG